MKLKRLATISALVALPLAVGAFVLQKIFMQADAAQVPVQVCALKRSASNRFYQRHGFEQVSESEWDLHYVRPPQHSTPGAHPVQR